MDEEVDYLPLVKRALNGDDHAYQDMYDATIKDVYKNVHFLMEDKTDVEDVIQEIYIQMYKSLKKYDPTKPFKPWLIGVAIKQIHSYRRKKWMSFRILKRAETVSREYSEDFTPGLIEQLSNETLITLIDQLPFKLKQVVILHYLNDYKQSEVAEILKIPVGTVKSRIHEALKKLRQKSKHNPINLEKVRNVL
ncbi:sigma-70 family RNA polymerase sigma factor [Alkalihalophilus lindianensis]|uniref:Sigma-70 family RNA polymerase sigma factor n=1 Tax=Alkalihalophilus lindianensis TaxID=1630542 RepID=A0ABU3X861_9BACI|nr:sigma-70 family RNA polymerase sigma factor [Alkalihalophilus lindianensis]MDV2684076.1 sigma-70 family RNA polymerase sigma factor [Alkalihalophilus lindianensis]